MPMNTRHSFASAERTAASIGGLSHPSKMPCASYSTPAYRCPTGAKLARVKGTTCADCYARKGCYTFRSTRTAMERRMDAVDAALASPIAAHEWCETMASVLNQRADAKPSKRDDGRVFRWHDSGDLQSAAHLALIVAVCEATPRTRHWLPTREAGFVAQYLADGGALPPNLTVRLSLARVDGKIPPAYARLAAHERVTLSGVHTTDTPAEGFNACPAYQNDGACGDCRACWDPAVNVSYPLH